MRKRHGQYPSQTNEWETPDYLFKYFDKIYKFNLDPCCTPQNAKCWPYYTKEDSGLFKSWAGMTVFMNPPYGREVSLWVKKAYEEVYCSNSDVITTVVCLIPARTDTRYWQEYCAKADYIIFLKGRVKFGKNKDFSSVSP